MTIQEALDILRDVSLWMEPNGPNSQRVLKRVMKFMGAALAAAPPSAPAPETAPALCGDDIVRRDRGVSPPSSLDREAIKACVAEHRLAQHRDGLHRPRLDPECSACTPAETAPGKPTRVEVCSECGAAPGQAIAPSPHSAPEGTLWTCKACGTLRKHYCDEDGCCWLPTGMAAPAGPPGSLWTTQAPLPGQVSIKVDSSITAEDVRRAVDAVQGRAAAFAPSAPAPPVPGGRELALEACLLSIQSLAAARLRNPPLAPMVEHDLREIVRITEGALKEAWRGRLAEAGRQMEAITRKPQPSPAAASTGRVALLVDEAMRNRRFPSGELVRQDMDGVAERVAREAARIVRSVFTDLEVAAPIAEEIARAIERELLGQGPAGTPGKDGSDGK